MLIGPYWRRLRRVLRADIAYRAGRLATGGFALAVADLHSDVRLVAGEEVDAPAIARGDRVRIGLDRRGLVLMPSVFGRPGVSAFPLPPSPWQPAVLYPARGVGDLWSPATDGGGALTAVVGRTKARLLTVLGAPASTTDLAHALSLSPGTVSEHLTALHSCGLLVRSRNGPSVLYARSALGEALVRQ